MKISEIVKTCAHILLHKDSPDQLYIILVFRPGPQRPLHELDILSSKILPFSLALSDVLRSQKSICCQSMTEVMA